MSHPATPPRHPRLRALGLLLVPTLLLAACTGSPATPRADTAPVTAAPQVTGPLCAALPTGTEPGNPSFLAGQPVEAALRWIPTLTTFEAALRASGVRTDLPAGVTVLAPSDDAFAATFSEDNWDDLMTHHTDQLRTLLKAHLITGTHPIGDLTTAGTATTLDGVTVTVTRTGPTARLGDRADTVCADYQATNARIHIINAVLGPLPVTADGTGHRAH
ncbi:fasciclin domain-containing protein [Micromonospora sp. NPDC048835]|uniref:fasciclin domain-containing protein n=1 Tax=Micromonospora sp. NPDC048835 TaxID=3155147 RepID=UPI003407105C